MRTRHMLDTRDLFYRFMARAACGRLVPLNTCYETWPEVTCRHCLKRKPRPKQKIPPPLVPPIPT